MKNWLVTAKLFMDANRIETMTIRCNTERKARIFATEKFQKKYSTVGNMVYIIKVEEM